jgi:hypothetical protein
MIESITFTNRFGRSLHCNLREPEYSNIAITDITGLGPGKSTMKINDIATSDGGIFSSARMGARNIVFTFRFIEYDPDYAYVPVEDSRRLSYEFFMPKTQIRVIIRTDRGREFTINGYVESNEPTIFSNQESSTVSLICPGYYFKMVSDTGDQQHETILGNGLFEFPFSNESTDGQKKIQFGEAERISTYELYYDGDTENGFELRITFLGNIVNEISVDNIPVGNTYNGDVGIGNDYINYPGWTDLDISSSFVHIDISALATLLSSVYSDPIYTNGNRIIITSQTGNKSVTFATFDGDMYNILDGVDHLDWLKLYPGYNRFRVSTDQASVGHFRVEAYFNTLYAGV